VPKEITFPTDLRDWLKEVLPRHMQLAAAVRPLLENMLVKKKVDYLSVTCRVKEIEGALEKVGRKDYADPKQQLTDLSGIRVITYLEEQVEAASKIIRELFEIDHENSLDRKEILGDDRVGYRSTHFVCTLGPTRDKLPEYEALGKLRFEIQVRTVLQHAWAELAHDRSFKFGSALPAKIQRKLNLYSGMLEIADTAFDEISKEIDEYSKSLKNKSIDQIDDVELSSISISKFAREISKQKTVFVGRNVQNHVVDELRNFGIETIGNLRSLITEDFLKAHLAVGGATNTLTGFLRRAMMYKDLKKYLQSRPRFGGVISSTFEFLKSRYGANATKRALKAAKIRWPQDAPE
jgi:ppGpp synthetase/RelA/SpoT-type nucleotidyltranferase